MICLLKNPKTISTNHCTAEGPIWDPYRKVFFYTDIERGTLYRYDPKVDRVTSWQIGSKGQMIGGGLAVNKDRTLLVMLETGPHQGINYFVPETSELINISNSWPEINKPYNRPNDTTVVDIGGEKRLVFGTMSKNWKSDLAQGKKEGAFYLLDENLIPQRLNIDAPYPGTLICNGLADGGTNQDGTINLFWAESIGHSKGAHVWRGKLNTKDFKVNYVKIFTEYLLLAGNSIAYPDGANMVRFKESSCYAVSILGLGEIRIFHKETSGYLGCIKLPQEATNITKFAIGEDERGMPALFVTTLNFDYPKIKQDGCGSTFLFSLPETIFMEPNSLQITDYMSKEEFIEKGSGGEWRVVMEKDFNKQL